MSLLAESETSHRAIIPGFQSQLSYASFTNPHAAPVKSVPQQVSSTAAIVIASNIAACI